jgi:hypothetical protein
MTEILFDAARHRYVVGGREYPSVTRVLAAAGLNDLSGIPIDVLQRKREIGIAVDLAIQLDIAGTLDDDSVDPAAAGYFRGWRRFRSDVASTVRWFQRRICDTTFGYAGTPDLGLEIGGDEWLVDVKTTAAESAAHGVQLAAYARPLGLSKRACLYLKPDGRFVFLAYTATDDYATFVACLTVYRYRVRYGLINNH